MNETLALASLTFHSVRADSILSLLLNAVIFVANLAGGIVVGVATVRGLLVYLRDLVLVRGEDVPKEAIRLSLGRALALALEFQLAADILSTALNPTRQDILVLGAIVILRTALNFFLGRELREAQKRAMATTHSSAAGASLSS